MQLTVILRFASSVASALVAPMIPMQRMGQAEEVAGLASYLMSDKAGYVTRQVISINGGML